jgi:hypothetical protein
MAMTLALGLSPVSASAEPPQVECGVTDIQYEVAANLSITNTPMGAGDGVHRVGPGKVVLRFDERPGHRGVSLLAYDLRQKFTVVARALLWTTRVSTDIATRASMGSPIADGTLEGHSLHWHGAANGLRSDGTLSCDGSMCGKFGAPPSGTSELHSGPATMKLESFEFGTDMKSFTMPPTLLADPLAGKERTFLSIAGREVRRACVPVAIEN